MMLLMCASAQINVSLRFNRSWTLLSGAIFCIKRYANVLDEQIFDSRLSFLVAFSLNLCLIDIVPKRRVIFRKLIISTNEK